MGYDGHHESVWDDLMVFPNNLQDIGANSPTSIIVANDGSATTGTAGYFDGTAYGIVPNYAALDTQTMSLSVWTNMDNTSQNEIVDRNGDNGFEFYVNSGQLYFSINGFGSVSTPSNTIVAGQTQHLVVTVAQEGANSRIKLYVNGTMRAENVVNDLLANLAVGVIVGEYNSGGWNMEGTIDYIQMFNVALSPAQVTEMYNSGEGLTTMPTGITKDTDMIMEFANSYANSCVLGDTYDMVGTNISLGDGLIGNTSDSFGVALKAWPAGVRTEVFFDVQLPHTYKQGTDIKPHVHWAVPSGDAGNVVWGLEYLWRNKDEAIGDTEIITNTITPDNHGVQLIDTIGTLSKPNSSISSILVCRLFRRGDDALDTYPHEVYLAQFDFHHEIDAPGSRWEWVK